MKTRVARKSWLTLAAMLALGAAAGLLGARDSGAVHADSGVTTETAAAAAGARCSPSAPVRQIEGLHERRISGSS
jgi:hypothetical protein